VEQPNNNDKAGKWFVPPKSGRRRPGHYDDATAGGRDSSGDCLPEWTEEKIDQVLREIIAEEARA
jgi:hypothetical protein